MPKRLEIIAGSKHNRLTIIKETEPELRYNKGMETPLRRFDCVCECGKVVNARMSALINGSTKSCGCFKNQNVMFDKTTHGLSKTDLYRVWANMIQRCENSRNRRYKDYGGRGIKVCQQWRTDFLSFYNWATKKCWKRGLQIDRENNDGDYEPGNCRIVTSKINNNNTRRCKMFEFNGQVLNLTEICDSIGVNYKTVYQRIFKYNWTFENAINGPT